MLKRVNDRARPGWPLVFRDNVHEYIAPMPSDALIVWQTERIRRLQNVEADCLHLDVVHAADPDRVQEHIRLYGVFLSAEFQGFCRDLHTECAIKLVDSINPVRLRAVLQSQCWYGRKLDTGNPNVGNLGADFNRYLLDFWAAVLVADPGHAARRNRLAMLNAWRNAVGHNDYDPNQLGGTTTLTIQEVRSWQNDCGVFATTFDAVMRDHLQATTGVSPWPP
jgi:hypothetical protein